MMVHKQAISHFIKSIEELLNRNCLVHDVFDDFTVVFLYLTKLHNFGIYFNKIIVFLHASVLKQSAKHAKLSAGCCLMPLMQAFFLFLHVDVSPRLFLGQHHRS